MDNNEYNNYKDYQKNEPTLFPPSRVQPHSYNSPYNQQKPGSRIRISSSWIIVPLLLIGLILAGKYVFDYAKETALNDMAVRANNMILTAPADGTLESKDMLSFSFNDSSLGNYGTNIYVSPIQPLIDSRKLNTLTYTKLTSFEMYSEMYKNGYLLNPYNPNMLYTKYIIDEKEVALEEFRKTISSPTHAYICKMFYNNSNIVSLNLIPYDKYAKTLEKK